MRDSDGFDLIRRVRQASDPLVRDIPAAALTAYARAADRMKALQAGFQMHLAKPVDPAELIIAVAALASSEYGAGNENETLTALTQATRARPTCNEPRNAACRSETRPS
jgi:CheY-like chemotaxis protein